MLITQKPFFLQRYRSYLLNWINKIREYIFSVDYIVAVSRKGPRLLELLAHYNMLEDDLAEHIRKKTVSEFAISRLEKAGCKKFLLVDDCVLYGSTFLRISDFIKLCHPHAEIIGVPFAVSLASSYAVRPLINAYGLLLRERELERYIIYLTKALQTLNKPLLVTLPIIETKLPWVDSWEQVKVYGKEFAASIDSDFFTLESYIGMSHSDGDIDVFNSGFVPIDVNKTYAQNTENSLSQNASAGFKFYLADNNDSETPILRIIPCCHLTFSLIATKGKTDSQWVRFLNGFVNDSTSDALKDDGGVILKNLAKQKLACHEFDQREIETLIRDACCMEGSIWYSKIPKEIVIDLANYHNFLTAFQFFSYYRNQFTRTFGKNNSCRFQTDADSVRLMIGNNKIDEITEELNHYLNDFASPEYPYPKEVLEANEVPCPDEFLPNIHPQAITTFVSNLSSIRNRMFDKKDWSPDKPLQEKISFAVDAFLWRQHIDLELLTRRLETDPKSRLTFGNSAEDFREIIFDMVNNKDNDEVKDFDKTDAKKIFRQKFEQSIDEACLVPCYFACEEKGSATIRTALATSGSKLHHDCILHVARYFRSGEGIPYSVKLFFAERMLMQLLKSMNYTDVKSFVEKNLDKLPWQLKELYQDKDIQCSIDCFRDNCFYDVPLYDDPQSKTIASEYISLWDDKTINDLKHMVADISVPVTA